MSYVTMKLHDHDVFTRRTGLGFFLEKSLIFVFRFGYGCVVDRIKEDYRTDSTSKTHFI